ncbi:AAA family ATPase [Plantactinospora solaniradicis]|uniref:AAA family ATPase n=1 Tax=Plantactinospora solaniradicis TaxID=1723736 RepID=A0ABW1K1T0_9ACTN
MLLLAGPPGAGKSTVAELLASSAEGPAVHLHTDSFHVWIRSGFVLPYLPEAARQNETVTEVMIAAALAYERGGYDVVLDGILGPWMLDGFRLACADVSYAVLRPSLDVALARAAAREGRQLTAVEPITGLYTAFADLGPLERHVVDSTEQTVEQTAAAVATGYRGGRFTL